MPTTTRLVAALWFAVLGWLAANAHIPALGEDARIGAFREITALIGALCGWLVMGRLTGRGWVESMNGGFRTSVTLAFFALLGFSTWLMLGEALQKRYEGPLEAVIGIFGLMAEHARAMLTLEEVGILALGGLAGGLLAEWVFRRWR